MTSLPPNNPLAADTAGGYSSDHLEDNRRVIAAYRYRDAGEHWNCIEAFVRTSVTLLMEREPNSSVGHVLTTVAKFALWAYLRGLPLEDPTDIFIPSNLNRFCADELDNLKPGYRKNVLHYARRAVNTIGDPDFSYPWKPKARNTEVGKQIYSREQQARFVSSCNNRNTAHQRSNIRVLLGLGFGAGVRLRELNLVRRCDIREEDGQVFVTVGGQQERTVPVRASWAKLLLRGLEDRKADDWAILGYRTPKIPQKLITEIYDGAPSEPHPSPAQMRATWVVEHLAGGLRFDVLAQIAGYRSVATFALYVHRMPAYNLDDYIDRIIGGEA